MGFVMGGVSYIGRSGVMVTVGWERYWRREDED